MRGGNRSGRLFCLAKKESGKEREWQRKRVAKKISFDIRGIGSGGGSVGREVFFYTIRQQFESHQRHH